MISVLLKYLFKKFLYSSFWLQSVGLINNLQFNAEMAQVLKKKRSNKSEFGDIRWFTMV